MTPLNLRRGPRRAFRSGSVREKSPQQLQSEKKEEEMLSEIPYDLERLDAEQLNRELVRVGMIAELDAVSLYEQLAAMTDHPLLKAVFLDIAGEEKTHMGEFQALLLRLDQEQARELEAGSEEVREIEEKL